MSKPHFSSQRRVSYLFLVLVLLLSLFMVRTVPVQAQGSKLPQPPLCPCVQKALGLLAQYNIPPTALNDMVPLLSDPKTLVTKLSGMGLDATAMGNLMNGLEPLAKANGLDMGAIKLYAAEHGLRVLEQDKIPDSAMADLLNAKTPEDQKAILAKYNVDADKLLKELNPYEELGLNQRTLGYYYAEQGVEVLAKYGVPHDALDEIVKAGDPAKTNEILAKYGLKQDAIDAVNKDMTDLTKEGLANGDVQYYAAVEVGGLLDKYGLPADVLQQAVELYTSGNMADLQKLAGQYNVDAAGFADIEANMKSLAAMGLDPTDTIALNQEIQADEANIAEAVKEPVNDPANTELESNTDQPVSGDQSTGQSNDQSTGQSNDQSSVGQSNDQQQQPPADQPQQQQQPADQSNSTN